MKKILLTLGVLLLATPALAEEYCSPFSLAARLEHQWTKLDDSWARNDDFDTEFVGSLVGAYKLKSDLDLIGRASLPFEHSDQPIYALGVELQLWGNRCCKQEDPAPLPARTPGRHTKKRPCP